MLDNLRRVTRPGGHLLLQTSRIIRVPGSWAKFITVRRVADRTAERGAGVWKLSVKSLETMVGYAGFERVATLPCHAYARSALHGTAGCGRRSRDAGSPEHRHGRPRHHACRRRREGAPGSAFADLAGQGIKFTRAVSPAPWTLPAHGSLFSGLEPFRHGLTGDFALPGGQLRPVTGGSVSSRIAGCRSASTRPAMRPSPRARIPGSRLGWDGTRGSTRSSRHGAPSGVHVGRSKARKSRRPLTSWMPAPAARAARWGKRSVDAARGIRDNGALQAVSRSGPGSPGDRSRAVLRLLQSDGGPPAVPRSSPFRPTIELSQDRCRSGERPAHERVRRPVQRWQARPPTLGSRVPEGALSGRRLVPG